ncbi:hypothetical protein DFP73DRAFT_560203 [Morchella snyderi]|nr:hypothetical protein DFP73DRAFT_560203 [Morchella snyderi]
MLRNLTPTISLPRPHKPTVPLFSNPVNTPRIPSSIETSPTMGITSTITHRLLTLSRPGLILNRGLNACVVPAFIVTSRSVASAATAKAKKPNTKTEDAATPKTSPKSSTEGRTKATATTTKAAGKTGSTTKKPATPKAASKKPIKKVAAKKELTDEQKKRLLIKQLKEKALDPPPRSGTNAYAIWFGKRMKERKRPATELAVAWKTLPQDVKDTYIKQAEEVKPVAVEEYAKWVKSMSPLVIREANHARRRLRALGVSTGVAQISDDRIPKRVTRPIFLYFQEQYGTGRKFFDAAGKNSVVVGTKVMTEEYEKLPESEKKRFEDMVDKNKQDYEATIAKLEKQRNI